MRLTADNIAVDSGNIMLCDYSFYLLAETIETFYVIQKVYSF